MFCEISVLNKNIFCDQFVFPLIACPCPQGGSAHFVDDRRSTTVTLLSESRSPIPRFTACPKQMGDSGNWHQRLQHAVMALSPEILHLYLFPPAVRRSMSAKARLAKTKKKQPSAPPACKVTWSHATFHFQKFHGSLPER